MFINSDHKILAQEEIIEKLRLEIVWLTHERDNLLLWNTELMRWKSEINSIKESTSKELYTIESILEETQKVMERNKENFYKLTDKQREKIKEFNEKIAEHIAILEEYEWKELIDIDSENKKIKKELSKAKKELKAMLDDAKELKKEREEFEKQKESVRKELDEERERYINYMNSLEKREETIKWREELHEITVQKFIQERDK